MAKTGGRNNWLAWPVGLLCAAVIGVLVVVALPMIGPSIDWVGNALRGPTVAPRLVVEPEDARLGTDTAPVDAVDPSESVDECRALYTDVLWEELSSRTGGEPIQDASAPITHASSLAAALKPDVQETCAWNATTTGKIVTTVSKVAGSAQAIAQASLGSQGYVCSEFGDGIRCTKNIENTREDHVFRDGLWVATQFSAWEPSLYTERVAERLWLK
ncbi:hypothetical protein FHX49_000978 [Microbacterium endophyticum]|uniref:Uncharacterized protein n=1 Tax=Microbacterium endophyticum TaxID=1526412 RepID=A0A7W4YMS9_9MICO|nr:hypothetical protein [Microbacterium endophyticum]MBB2975412.1 hypothetical protein [Microbacterium endophyticum]NIK35569.1 hypothetical protein [Microbacterium endophyticum]